MISIFIQGLKDGEYNIDQKASVSDVPDLAEEFIGDINLSGKLLVLGKRYTFQGIVKCNSKLVCDRSLVEFEQFITAEFSIAFIADNSLSRFTKKNDIDKTEVIIISDDNKEIDITEIIREELILNLPMKRISPDFRDKELSEIFPELMNKENKEETDIQNSWFPIKKLKIN